MNPGQAITYAPVEILCHKPRIRLVKPRFTRPRNLSCPRLLCKQWTAWTRISKLVFKTELSQILIPTLTVTVQRVQQSLLETLYLSINVTIFSKITTSTTFRIISNIISNDNTSKICLEFSTPGVLNYYTLISEEEK